ncbi:MAG: phage holin family protein [Chloroflexi bacterium]|nr:phage holin family protein [Chloroflexota bacterium]
MALREGRRPADGPGESDAGFSRAWSQAQDEARGIGDRIGRITSELRVLSAREMDLARAEMLDTWDAAQSAGIWGGVAAVFGVIMLQFLALAGMLALAQVLGMWAAALIVAGVLLVIAGIGAWMARSALTDFSLVPKHTIRSVQEDMRWARERVRRNNG